MAFRVQLFGQGTSRLPPVKLLVTCGVLQRLKIDLKACEIIRVESGSWFPDDWVISNLMIPKNIQESIIKCSHVCLFTPKSFSYFDIISDIEKKKNFPLSWVWVTQYLDSHRWVAEMSGHPSSTNPCDVFFSVGWAGGLLQGLSESFSEMSWPT